MSLVVTVVFVWFRVPQNAILKKDDPIPPHQTLLAYSVVAAVFGVGTMLLRLASNAMDELLADPSAVGNTVEVGPVIGDGPGGWIRASGIDASLCFVGYNIASLTLLARLIAVGHTVSNYCKRMVLYINGFLFFGEMMQA